MPAARRLAVLSTSTALALAAALAWTWWSRPTPGRDGAPDPEVLRRAALELARTESGLWDSHPDPDVGRVLQPGLRDRRSGRIAVSTNALGLRERAFELEKPPGTTRVVFLGDSFVFGSGVAADERMGVFLEEALRARASGSTGAPGPIECLHVGMTDWNAVASASFLRRQLAPLRPDLVVHVLVWNDLDDASAARGFGALAGFTSQRRRAADGLVADRHPFLLGVGDPLRTDSLLSAGLDGESRGRYAAARAAVERLAAAVEVAGGRYLALLFWAERAPVAQRLLVAGLREEQLAYVPSEVYADPRWSVARDDAHWNAAGMRRVAELVYGLARERGLLAPLALEPWPAADAAVREWHAVGRREARTAPPPPALPVAARVDFGALTRATAAQVHGGLDREGRAAPYASLVLRNPGAARLRVRARFLDRPEMDGGTVHVFLDEVEVDAWTAAAGAAVATDVALPDDVAGRPYLALRFEASDWVLEPPDLRRCRAFRLETAELAP